MDDAVGVAVQPRVRGRVVAPRRPLVGGRVGPLPQAVASGAVADPVVAVVHAERGVPVLAELDPGFARVRTRDHDEHDADDDDQTADDVPHRRAPPPVGCSDRGAPPPPR